jgi:AcrR family transcriptional regulator
MAAPASEKTRDAGRSREALLAAAENLFAERGYEGASLNDIASAAGLSRGAPNYFFGSKDQLYSGVIERTFAARDQATRAAFEPVREWCNTGSGFDDLRGALASAAEDYMAFLAERPTFVKLIMREELSGGASIRSRQRRSAPMEDAFAALRSAGAGRGLSEFAVEDALLLFIALTFAPMSFSNTLMRAVRRELRKPAARKRQVKLAVSELMHLLTG